MIVTNYPLVDLSNTLPHFRMHHLPRKHKKGGGVFLLSHKGLQVTENQLMVFKSFEYMDFYVTDTKSPPLRLVAIYRPPPSQTNKLTVTTFFRVFSTLLEVVSIDPFLSGISISTSMLIVITMPTLWRTCWNLLDSNSTSRVPLIAVDILLTFLSQGRLTILSQMWKS